MEQPKPTKDELNEARALCDAADKQAREALVGLAEAIKHVTWALTPDHPRLKRKYAREARHHLVEVETLLVRAFDGYVEALSLSEFLNPDDEADHEVLTVQDASPKPASVSGAEPTNTSRGE